MGFLKGIYAGFQGLGFRILGDLGFRILGLIGFRAYRVWFLYVPIVGVTLRATGTITVRAP